MKKYLSLFIFLMVALPLEANTSKSLSHETIKQELSIEERQQAQQWGLTTIEWDRYKQLMQSERGIWSPNLDPITVLGIEAKTEQERTRYAELLVHKEFQRVEKELAFQRAYDTAWQKIHPGMTPLSISANEPYAVVKAQPGFGRLVLFITLDCLACNNLLSDVLATEYPIDIYIRDNHSTKEIQQWAINQHIDIKKVNSHHITINHDSGQWLEIANGRMPALMQKQNNHWRQVTL